MKIKEIAGDTISRKAAIDAVERNACNTQRIYDAIKDLPPARPEIIHCRECINHTYIRQIEGGTIGVCESLGLDTYGNWYCGNAERRTDGN